MSLRRRNRLILALFSVIAIAAGGAYVLRAPLLEMLIKQQLAAYGYPRAQLSVGAVRWDRLSLHDIVLNAGAAPVARVIELGYTPATLLKKQIESIHLSGLDLEFTFNSARLQYGELQPLVERFRENTATGSAGVPAMPAIEINQSRLKVLTPVYSGIFEFAGKLSDGRFTMTSAFKNNDGLEIFTLRLAVDDVFATPHVDLSIESVAGIDRELWTWLSISPPTGGRLQTQLEITGRLQHLAAPSSVPELVAWLEAGQWRGVFALNAEDLGYQQSIGQINFHGQWLIQANGGILSFTLEDDFFIEIKKPRPFWQQFLPAKAQSLAGVPGNSEQLRFTSGSKIPLRFIIEPDPETGSFALISDTHLVLAAGNDKVRIRGRTIFSPAELRAQITLQLQLARLAYADFNARELTIELPVMLTWKKNLRQATLVESAYLAAQNGQLAGFAQIAKPLRIHIPEAKIEFDNDDSLNFSLLLKPDSTAWRLLTAERPALAAAGDIKQLKLAGRIFADGELSARIEFAGENIELPDYRVHAKRIAGGFFIDTQASGLSAHVSADELTHRLDTGLAAAAPLSAMARIQLTGKRYQGEGEGYIANSKIPFSFAGDYDLRHDKGELSLSLPQLKFDKSLQPGDLFPLLKEIGQVSGFVSASSRWFWDGQRFDGSAVLSLDDLTLRYNGIEVQSLQSRVVFDHLLPLSTPAEQHAQALKIDVGLPLDYPELSFSLSTNKKSQLEFNLSRAAFGFAGGTVAVYDAPLVIGGQGQALKLHLSYLDLGRLFEQIAIEGLSGSGRLSGELPLLINQDSVSIADGRLHSASGGIIRYRSDTAEQTLAGGGEQVQLMLQALRNFHYSSLELIIAMQADGQTRLQVSMQGHNPDLLAGQPFDFNIALDGNIRPLLQALQTGDRISDDWIRRNWLLDR